MYYFLITFTLIFSEAFGFPNGDINIPKLDGRIVGGISTTIERYPYQISLQWWNRHTCGGSLISQQWVVTAAHCTYGGSPSLFTIRSGTTFRNRGGTVTEIDFAKGHPKYNPSTIDFDISVIHLKKAVILGSTVGLIKLPSKGRVLNAGYLATVTGWGTIREGGFSSDELQRVEVPLVSNKDCSEAYSDYLITDRMICAGFKEGGKDACQGDSGGPLVIDKELIGIVSWGYGCARPKYPGVYSNVINLREYITEISGI